ncbi:hypothetical protein D3C80_1974990 [compost metagenome]
MLLIQEPGQYQSIATIIAFTTKNTKRVLLQAWMLLLDCIKNSGRCPLHQVKTADPLILHRLSIYPAHLGRRKYFHVYLPVLANHVLLDYENRFSCSKLLRK